MLDRRNALHLLKDTYEDQRSVNEIMRTLTVLTAIFLPLNLITGIFGMNFDALPLIHSGMGFWAACGMMACVVVGLVWWFRRQRFLGD